MVSWPRLLADDEPVESVGVLVRHLDAFDAIDPAVFHRAFECFTASRPFVSTEDALRSVPRGFGVRAEPPRV
ncbi:hypothetical protein [Kocuria sp. NPDC057446]|uniref:hypothetical protein n=1 Tax=Kocuria sp. NPDC057446 TaxID=3346137 RepID=UPI0036C9F2D9